MDVEPRRAQRLIEAQNQVLRMIVAGVPAQEVFDHLTRFCEAESDREADGRPGLSAAILLLDPDTNLLVWASAPSIPEDVRRGVPAIPVGEECGSSGAAAYKRERVVLTDIEQPRFAVLRLLSDRLGARSVASAPVISSDGQVLGTISFTFTRPHGPNQYEVQLQDTCANLAALALVRDREQNRLRLWEQMFQHASWGMALISAETDRLIAVNPAFARMFDYAEHELLGRVSSSLYAFYCPPEMHDGHRAYECFRITRQGEMYPVLVDLADICDAEGNVRFRAANVQDITERKRAEAEIHELNQDLERRVQERTEALRRAKDDIAQVQAKLQAVLDSATEVAVIALDERGIITLFNSGAEKMLGWQAEEVVGRTTYAIFYRPEQQVIGSNTEKLFEEQAEHPFITEATYVRRDGAPIFVSLAATPMLDASGKRTGTLGIATNISPRKRLEAELRKSNYELEAQRRAAEEANRAKSEFLAAMSHEIRTPMNAILGMADLLSATALTSDQRQYVDVFRRNGQNLLTLINDILDLSKIEAGQFELEQIAFDLCDTVDRTLEMMLPKARAKNILLRADMEQDVACGRIGDPTRLQQVLVNLLGNAIKFTERGSVVLRVSAVGDGRVRMEVTDTGIGIPADQLDAIFDDFKQAESSITRRFGGTGLGLSIARRLVRRMGGELQVTSELGRGSRFWFEVGLPIGLEEPVRTPENLRTLAGAKVLIVDYDATSRLILRNLCTQFEMSVCEAPDTGSALVELERAVRAGNPFGLVLLDRGTPDADGFQASIALRQICPELPIIIISSDNRPGDATRSRELNIDAYLEKPVGKSELLRAMSAAIDLRPKSPAAPAPLRVLIAEDSEDNRFLFEAYLKDTPYQRLYAVNGEDAISKFMAGEFDLVLMDVQMPVLDGLTAASRIREYERLVKRKCTPILAVTANAMAGDAERCLRAGCDAHIAKPISKARLIAAIEEWRRASSRTDFAVEIPEGLESLSATYLSGRRRDLATSEDLLRTQDFVRLASMGHDMKGTGASYGFPDLTRLGAAMEEAARQQDELTLRAHIAEFARYLKFAERAISRTPDAGE